MSDVIDLLRDLVGIDSVNPSLVTGGQGEGRIAQYVAEWLDRQGFRVSRIEDIPGRPSIVGVMKGSGGGRSLMFNGHLDVVGVEGYEGDPFTPRVEHGRLYGRGSCDMKGGVAAMLVAAQRAARKGTAGDLIVACVADEERSSIGTEQLLTRFTADAAIVTEPTDLALRIAHKGFIWFDVAVEGRAAHGSRPDLGIDAILKAGKFLVAVEAEDRRLRAGQSHPLVGSPSIHASLIEGGQELSSYSAQCRIAIERRTIPGESSASISERLQGIIEAIATSDAEFKATLTAGLAREPLEIAPDIPIVTMLGDVFREKRGEGPKMVGAGGWTDCALLSAAGIPSLLFGPKGAGAHATTEYVDLESVEVVSDILTETALRFCGST